MKKIAHTDHYLFKLFLILFIAELCISTEISCMQTSKSQDHELDSDQNQPITVIPKAPTDFSKTMTALQKYSYGGASIWGSSYTAHAPFLLQYLLQQDPDTKIIDLSPLGTEYPGTVARELNSTLLQIQKEVQSCGEVNVTLRNMLTNIQTPQVSLFSESDDFAIGYTYYKEHASSNPAWGLLSREPAHVHAPQPTHDPAATGILNLAQHGLNTGNISAARACLVFLDGHPEFARKIDCDSWNASLKILDHDDRYMYAMIAYVTQLYKQRLERNTQMRDIVNRWKRTFPGEQNIVTQPSPSHSIPKQILHCVAQQLQISLQNPQGESNKIGQSSASSAGNDSSNPNSSRPTKKKQTGY